MLLCESLKHDDGNDDVILAHLTVFNAFFHRRQLCVSTIVIFLNNGYLMYHCKDFKGMNQTHLVDIHFSSN